MDTRHWSVIWALFVILLLLGYLLGFPTHKKRIWAAIVGCSTLYIALGSPLKSLVDFGLHSMSMIQQMLLILVVPLFWWLAFPDKRFHPNNRRQPHIGIWIFWLLGTAAMWISHYCTAAKLSVATGIPICGITGNSHPWLAGLPDQALTLFMVLAGILFFKPIFYPQRSQVLHPMAQVAYLFSSCVCCTVLGLWITFGATDSLPNRTASLLTTQRSPLHIDLYTDQQLSGLIMWVPGCLIYALLSMSILVQWFDGKHIPRILPIKNTAHEE